VRNNYQRWEKILHSQATATEAEEFKRLSEKLKQDIEAIFDDVSDLEETISYHSFILTFLISFLSFCVSITELFIV
jgi:hypothetical protein